MWSGPRNISTAMMRAWGNRADTAVIDEPFYAYYLKRTGKKHPGAAEIIAGGETDWQKIVADLRTGPIPSGKRIFFQKQMTHHLLPKVDREWIVDLTNCFLIRDPREVILSYIKKNPEPVLEDLGFVEQCEIWTRGMFWKIPSEYCEFFVTRSAFLSTWRCCHGLRVYATAMESGQNIGTTRSQDRYRSSPTNREKEMFQTASARFMSNAVNATKSFINIGFTETQKIGEALVPSARLLVRRLRQTPLQRFSAFPAFPFS